jgi:transposase
VAEAPGEIALLLAAQERKAYRQKYAVPILDKLRKWLDASLPNVPPGTLAGKALNYLHNEWPKLIRYLEDGRLEIDNNLAENAIRPFVIGRKNFLFSDSVHGVKASANLYSLVESAKASGLEPYQYLRQVFTRLPQAETVEDIENLLPWALKKILLKPDRQPLGSRTVLTKLRRLSLYLRLCAYVPVRDTRPLSHEIRLKPDRGKQKFSSPQYIALIRR